MESWKHIFKLDPAKKLSDKSIEQLCTSGTDAIMIGGTDDVTREGVLHLLTRIEQYSIPTILEISTTDIIMLGFDYYFIPMVMNSTEKKWVMDAQHHAIKEYKDYLIGAPPLFIEGYCILNKDSKAFIQTKCALPEAEDVTAYAYMAEHLFKLPIFYVEYSGIYGDPELVRQVKSELDHTLLFYGGGITTNQQAIEMKEYADVIIVGNSIYTHFEQAIQTVSAVEHMK